MTGGELCLHGIDLLLQFALHLHLILDALQKHDLLLAFLALLISLNALIHHHLESVNLDLGSRNHLKHTEIVVALVVGNLGPNITQQVDCTWGKLVKVLEQIDCSWGKLVKVLD